MEGLLRLLIGLGFPLELAAATLAVTQHASWRPHGRVAYLAVMAATGLALALVILSAIPAESLLSRAAAATSGPTEPEADIDGTTLILSMGYYGVQALASWAALMACARASKLEALVLAAAGYGTQHVASGLLQLALLAVAACAGGSPTRSQVSFWLCYALVYTGVYLLLWWEVGRGFVVDSRKIHASMGRTLLCASLLVMCIALNLAFAERMGAGLPALACRIYDVLCTTLGLVLLVILSRADQLSSDLATAREQRDAQARHHDLEADGLRRVNRIFHDALHRQAERALGESPATDEASEAPLARPADAQKLSEAIASYDSLVQSGDPALDALLTDKGAELRSKGVTLTAMVDGAAFRFMGEHDARELWSAVLDCLAGVAATTPDPELRTVSVTAARHGPTVALDGQCFCAEDLPLAGELPRTPGGAGASVALVRLVDRYGGRLHGAVADGVYTLHVVLVPGAA